MNKLNIGEILCEECWEKEVYEDKKICISCLNNKIKNEIIDLLKTIDIDFNIDTFNAIEDFSYFEEYIDFTCEEIYYADAMEYLMEHDPSLCLSTKLAEESGYDCSMITSCLLAELLQEQEKKDAFNDKHSEFEDLFEELLPEGKITNEN